MSTDVAPASPELLTIAEVAVLLRVDQKTIRRWIASGQLVPTFRIGATTRFDRSAILARQVAPPGGPSSGL